MVKRRYKDKVVIDGGITWKNFEDSMIFKTGYFLCTAGLLAFIIQQEANEFKASFNNRNSRFNRAATVLNDNEWEEHLYQHSDFGQYSHASEEIDHYSHIPTIFEVGKSEYYNMLED